MAQYMQFVTDISCLTDKLSFFKLSGYTSATIHSPVLLVVCIHKWIRQTYAYLPASTPQPLQEKIILQLLLNNVCRIVVYITYAL